MRGHLIQIRKEAEQAVRDMPEGDLKLKAFETILAHLLASGSVASTQGAPADKKAPQAREVSSTKVPASVSGRILSLRADRFFEEERSIADIRQELKTHGWHYPATSLSGALQSLVQKRELRREQVADERGRKHWGYSNP